MAVEQTILMTAIPRGIAVDTDTLPVSVFVSPRLRGAVKLGAFPDWLSWTRRIAEDGLTLTLRCGAETVDVAVDQERLDPGLWERSSTRRRSSARTSSTTSRTGRCSRTRCARRSAC